jgi:hypothetical protein
MIVTIIDSLVILCYDYGYHCRDIGHHSFASAYRPWMGYNLFKSKEGPDKVGITPIVECVSNGAIEIFKNATRDIIGSSFLVTTQKSLRVLQFYLLFV